MNKTARQAIGFAAFIFIILVLNKGIKIENHDLVAPPPDTRLIATAGSARGVLMPLDLAFCFAEAENPSPKTSEEAKAGTRNADNSVEAINRKDIFFAGSSIPSGAFSAVFAGKAGCRVRIAAAGDVMLHQRCHRSVRQKSKGPSNNFGYDGLFTGMPETFLDSDVAVANMEFPVHEKRMYEKPFIFHGELPVLYSLKRAGFHIVNAANNHSFDHGRQSPASTYRLCEKAGVACLGVGPDRAKAQKPHIVKINGIKLAFIGYSFLYNANYNSRNPERPHVNGYDIDGLVAQVKEAQKHADGVIVNLHWGAEYRTYPLRWQTRHARRLVEAGACLILGHHSHVPGHVRVMETEDGRKALVAYSLSNLVCNQSRRNPYGLTRLGAVLKADLVKTKRGVEVTAWNSLPTWVYNDNLKVGGELIEDVHVEVVPLRLRDLKSELGKETEKEKPDRKILKKLEEKIRFFENRTKKASEVFKNPSGSTDRGPEMSSLFVSGK